MATLTTGPVWEDHHQDGETYSIAHLHPVFIDYFVPPIVATARKPGRAGLTVKVRISYSHHCFTQALGKLPNANPDHYYNCTKRRNDPRVFCTDRWNETLGLPALVLDIGSCYFTGHHNYFVWRDPQDLALGEYFVYFSVELHEGGFVNLLVESAYPRTDGHREKKYAKKTSLNTLVVNAVRGRRTHAPP